MSKDFSAKNKMGVEPIPSLILSMGLPMIFSMMLQAFYNIIDSYFVSKMTSPNLANMGEYAINALTLSFPIQILMIAIGVGTGVGVNSLLSKTLGEGERDKASQVAGNAVFLALVTYLGFLLVGLFGLEFYLKTQTQDPLVISMALDYLRICTVFSFGSILSMIYEKLLQGTGNTLLATIGQTAGVLVNIVLDPILIFGLLGFPALGIKGAAIATVIGQIFTLVLSFFLHIRYNKELDNKIAYIRPDKKTIREIYRVGLPAIIMQSLTPFMTFGINIIFSRISSSAVTAYGVYFKVQQFIFLGAFGMNNAVIPVVAYNYGRRDRSRIEEAIKYGMIYTISLMLIGAILIQALAGNIVGIFNLSKETSYLAVLALRIITISYPLTGGNIIFQGVFQSFGQGIKSLAIALVRLILIPLVLAFFFIRMKRAEVFIWTIFIFAEFFGLILGLYFYKDLKKNFLKTI